ncbi:MAG: hypothetical protein WCK98_08075 [bacterium]
MYSVVDATKRIVQSNQFLAEYLASELINTSQYARKIKAEVEALTMKSVELNTIVTSLNRIKKSIQTKLNVDFFIDNVQMKYPISDIVYTKFDNDYLKIADLYKEISKTSNSFLNITQSQGETNIFVNSIFSHSVLEKFKGHKPLYQREDLAGMVIKFSPKYMDVAGSAFSVIRTISLEGVNLIEVLSTYTEMSVFVDFKDSQRVMEIIKENFLRR